MLARRRSTDSRGSGCFQAACRKKAIARISKTTRTAASTAIGRIASSDSNCRLNRTSPSMMAKWPVTMAETTKTTGTAPDRQKAIPLDTPSRMPV